MQKLKGFTRLEWNGTAYIEKWVNRICRVFTKEELQTAKDMFEYYEAKCGRPKKPKERISVEKHRELKYLLATLKNIRSGGSQ